MSLEDFNEDPYKLTKQNENEVDKKNNYKSDSSVISSSDTSTNSFVKDGNEASDESDSEIDSQNTVNHVAKKIKLDDNTQETEENDQDTEDKKNNSSDDESTGSFTDYTTTELEEDNTDDGDDECSILSTDSELYAKQIEEEDSDDSFCISISPLPEYVDGQKYEETDVERSSFSDDSSIIFNNQFNCEKVNPFELNDDDANTADEEDTSMDVEDQNISIIDEDIIDEYYSPEEDETTSVENNASNQQIEIVVDIFQEPHDLSIQADIIFDGVLCSADEYSLDDIQETTSAIKDYIINQNPQAYLEIFENYPDNSSNEGYFSDNEESETTMETDEDDLISNASSWTIDVSYNTDDDVDRKTDIEDIFFDDNAVSDPLDITDDDAVSSSHLQFLFVTKGYEDKNMNLCEAVQNMDNTEHKIIQAENKKGDEFKSSYQGCEINMGVLSVKDESTMNKLINEAVDENDKPSDTVNINVETDSEVNKVDEEVENNNEAELPAFSELEAEILNRFNNSDDELENIIGEKLQNQKYENK